MLLCCPVRGEDGAGARIVLFRIVFPFGSGMRLQYTSRVGVPRRGTMNCHDCITFASASARMSLGRVLLSPRVAAELFGGPGSLCRFCAVWSSTLAHLFTKLASGRPSFGIVQQLGGVGCFSATSQVVELVGLELPRGSQASCRPISQAAFNLPFVFGFAILRGFSLSRVCR